MATMQQISEQIRNAGMAFCQKVQPEALEGGLADDVSDDEFDASALAKGVAVEREHTTDVRAATEIAKDHLREDPKYYDKLEQIEGVDKVALAKFRAA